MTNYSAGRSRRAAFTLIELLTVITIILILAGLILGIAGSAQNKAARSRAEGEIQAMSTACNNYQIDNGTYPRVSTGTNNTDTLDAQKSYDPTNAAYTAASLDLYQIISGAYYYDSTSSTYKLWSSSAPVAQPTAYFTFKDSQLAAGGVTSGYINPSTVTAIVDPFGFSYGYSTAYVKDLETTPTAVPTRGYNPTYDLWSTAGYSTTSGKPYPTPAASPAQVNYSTYWVKNW